MSENIEIGGDVPRRSGRATSASKSNRTAPDREPIGEAEKPSRRRRANGCSEINAGAPSVATIVAELAQLTKLRRFCIVSQSRIDRSMESLIANFIGFPPEATEKQRKAVFAQAKAFRLSVEKGSEGHRLGEDHMPPALAPLIPMIALSAQSRAGWDDQRDASEDRMRELAALLPVWEFASTIKGLGPKQFAIIVGEAGIPIGDYRTVSGLWKRMGVAVINGKRQQRKSGDEGILQGYSPTRRAELYVIGDVMFRQQWKGASGGEDDGEDEAVPAHPTGPYGGVYAHRRAVTAPRIEATADLPLSSPDKWTKGRCHKDALRVMTKALLRDLWIAWRRVEGRSLNGKN